MELDKDRQRENNVNYFNFTAVCDDCRPPNGIFSGSVRAKFESGRWIISDTGGDAKGTLAYLCVQHHLQMKKPTKHHNHFTLKDGDKTVGKCGLGGTIGYLAGILTFRVKKQ